MFKKLLERIPFTWFRVISWDKSNPDKWELIEILEANWLTNFSGVKWALELSKSNPEARHIEAYPFVTYPTHKGAFNINFIKWRVK